MFDKLNMKALNYNNEILNKNNNGDEISFTQQKKDKGVSKMNDPHDFSLDDTVKIFSRYSFANIVKRLVDENACHLADGSIWLDTLKVTKPYILVQILNTDTARFQDCRYSQEEFYSLLNLLKQNAVNKHPEKTEEYESLCLELRKKIDMHGTKKI